MSITDSHILLEKFRSAVGEYLRRAGASSLRPRAALCDMDGTLYDSMPRHADAWRRMMLEQGIDVARDRFFSFEGMTGAATIRLLFREFLGREVSDEDCKRLYAVKSKYFHYFQETEGIPTMSGAPELIRNFVAEGIRPALVTGSGQATLLDRLDTDYDGAFAHDMRVTSHNVTHGKPHPEPYLKAMEMAGVRPDEAIVLENAPLGVESGARSGAFVIAVATGPIPVADLGAAGADIVFGSMPECRDAFPLLLQAIRER